MFAFSADGTKHLMELTQMSRVDIGFDAGKNEFRTCIQRTGLAIWKCTTILNPVNAKSD